MCDVPLPRLALPRPASPNPAGQRKDRKQRKEERKQRMAARKAERSGLPKQVGRVQRCIRPGGLPAAAPSTVGQESAGLGQQREVTPCGQQNDPLNCAQEITAEDIAKLTARPAAADEEAAGASEDSGSDSDSSSAGEAEQQQQAQQQQQEQQTEGQVERGLEQQGARHGEACAAAAQGSSEEAAGSGGSGADEPGAVDGGAGGAAEGMDDAAEVAALLREENVEALAEEEREKLTQVGCWRSRRWASQEGKAHAGLAARLHVQSRFLPTCLRTPPTMCCLPRQLPHAAPPANYACPDYASRCACCSWTS